MRDAPLEEARAWAAIYEDQAFRRSRACQVSLDMSGPAQASLARRQEILIANDRWPLRHWYNDEDFCRAYNTAVSLSNRLAEMTARAEAAEAVIRDVFSYDPSMRDEACDTIGHSLELSKESRRTIVGILREAALAEKERTCE